jgi:DNA-binding GntR family transcriptional regulator
LTTQIPWRIKRYLFWIQYTKRRSLARYKFGQREEQGEEEVKEVFMENTVGGIRVNKRKSLREEVYDSLRRSIIHGKLKAGQRLIEETLAHQVGISRTPVREAFHKLERDDLVVRLPKGGFAVKKFTQEDVEEIFGIRSALESYAAYLATIHITTEKFALLEKKVEESEKALDTQDFDKVVQLNTEFHDLLYKASKSKKLAEMINNYSDYFYRYRSALIHTENGFRYSVNDHQRMIEAMKRKNPRLVERLVRRHLDRGKEIILKEIDEGKMTP